MINLEKNKYDHKMFYIFFFNTFAFRLILYFKQVLVPFYLCFFISWIRIRILHLDPEGLP